MRMVAEMDAGPVYATARVTVLESDETPSLTDRLSRLGAELLVSSLPAIAAGTLVAVPQEDEHVTFCPKIDRDDGQVDWSRPAIELEKKSRAFTPWPGLFCHRGKERVKLVGVKVVPGDARPYAPGTVVAAEASIVIAAGDGLVSISRLQRDGRKELPSSDFVRGERVVAGEVWQ
jgi:methionyl-tRNA formyltransferase